MAIEDILQVTERDYNPLGDSEGVNQTEFLRFQEQMGLGQGEIMGKLIQMFKEAPSDFTAKFGMEAADSIREFLQLTTQKELQNRGQVFRDNSSEYIGQNIDYTPDQSAIGTLQTDQAAKAEQMIEFMKKQLQFKEAEKIQQSLQDKIGPEGLLRAVKEGEGLQESLRDYVGPGGFLSGVKKEDELQESLQDRLNTQSLLKRIQLQDQLMDTEWITKKDKEWITKKDKEEKNFLVDIMKDIIQGGMDTGSGIINAIMDEAKQLYREHTEKSADYDPKFFEKEQLNETTEDYYPPQP